MTDGQYPLVSIVIPAYNAMPYLEEAIESVLKQDYPNVELIVLDDGSQDNTSEFLQKYHGQFYFEKHNNMGQAATLNKGWNISKGEIVGYLSGDDILMPNALSVLVNELIREPDAVLVYPNYNLIDADSRFIRTVKSPSCNYYEMLRNIGFCQVGLGALFWKSAISKVGGWNKGYNFIPDLEHHFRLARLGKFQHVNQVLGGYRVHSDSTSQKKIDFAKADEHLVLVKQLLEIDDPCLVTEKKIILSRAYLISGRNHWRGGRYKIAIKYFLYSFSLWPKNLLNKNTYKIILNALINQKAHSLLNKARNLLCSKV